MRFMFTIFALEIIGALKFTKGEDTSTKLLFLTSKILISRMFLCSQALYTELQMITAIRSINNFHNMHLISIQELSNFKQTNCQVLTK